MRWEVRREWLAPLAVASLAAIAKGVEGLKKAAASLARWWKGVGLSLFVLFTVDRGMNHRKVEAGGSTWARGEWDCLPSDYIPIDHGIGAGGSC